MEARLQLEGAGIPTDRPQCALLVHKHAHRSGIEEFLLHLLDSEQLVAAIVLREVHDPTRARPELLDCSEVAQADAQRGDGLAVGDGFDVREGFGEVDQIVSVVEELGR